jgi:asparagine synthase (glutamine-hydrolysing)
LGWVGGDRTLKHDIRVIPGGQCWIWQQGNTKPKQKAYFPPFLLAHQRQKAFRKSDIKQPHDSFIRHEVLVLTKFYLQRFVEEAIDECIAPQDVPDVFYMYDRVRRWAGTNARKGISTGDRFSLLCTRSFVKGAFTIPALHRYSESLHYELIRLLVPDLHSVPFVKTFWCPQYPIINLFCQTTAQSVLTPSLKRTLRRVIQRRVIRLNSNNNSSKIPVFDQAAWLESKLAWIRELCLDQPGSELWNFVDKPTFERITSATANQVDRRPNVHRLYDVATLFYYALT